jgi:protoheme IX farnesyltransferase
VKTDYSAANIPMLPVVSGEVATRRQIWFYTAIMAAAAMAPVLLRLTGLIYGVTALLGTGLFVIFAFEVYRRREADPSRMGPERRLFKYSILYLFALFGAVVVDRWVFA